MKCPRCHVALPKNTRFCPSCGLPVEGLFAKSEEASVAPPEQLEAREASDKPGESSGPAASQPSQTGESGSQAEARDVAEQQAEAPADGLDDAAAGERIVDDEGSPSASDGAGKAVPDDAGDDVEDAAAGEQADVDEPIDDVERTMVIESPSSTKVSKVRILVIVAAVLCVLGLAVWAVLSAQEAARAHAERERQVEAAELSLKTPQSVNVELRVPNEESASDMPVVLKVVGRTRAGDSVNETRAVTLDEHALSLLPGRYEISLAGNAMSSDGNMYVGTVDSYDIVVALSDQDERILAEEAGDDAQDYAESDEKSDTESDEKAATELELPVFVFSEVAPQDIRDEEIEAARASLQTADVDPTPYVQAVTARRTETIDRLNAEAAARLEEQMREAEEVARAVEQQVSEYASQQESEYQEDGEQESEQLDYEQSEDYWSYDWQDDGDYYDTYDNYA